MRTQYGDEEFEQEPIEDFEAFEDRAWTKRVLSALKKSSSASTMNAGDRARSKEWVPSSMSVSSRDVKLAVLQHRFLSAKGAEGKALAASLVKQEVDYRASVDVVFDELVNFVAGYYSNEMVQGDDAIDAIKYGHIRPTDYVCLKQVYAAYEANCDAFGDYSLQYVSMLVNLCELFGDPDLIRSAMKTVCK